MIKSEPSPNSERKSGGGIAPAVHRRPDLRRLIDLIGALPNLEIQWPDIQSRAHWEPCGASKHKDDVSPVEIGIQMQFSSDAAREQAARAIERTQRLSPVLNETSLKQREIAKGGQLLAIFRDAYIPIVVRSQAWPQKKALKRPHLISAAC